MLLVNFSQACHVGVLAHPVENESIHSRSMMKNYTKSDDVFGAVQVVAQLVQDVKAYKAAAKERLLNETLAAWKFSENIFGDSRERLSTQVRTNLDKILSLARNISNTPHYVEIYDLFHSLVQLTAQPSRKRSRHTP